MEHYSVLMSVYDRENPRYLQESIESMRSQTVPADDFVLVCDGPLTKELDAVIAEYPELHVVRLSEHQGLGRALRAGLRHCRHDLVARMDSDDISRSDRCERELEVFSRHPEVDLVSGTIEEFVGERENVIGRRVLPQEHADIARFARCRNPFNHPAVMFRKGAVEAAGGYRDFDHLEDYYLWVRMLMRGSHGYNLSSPLVWMRSGPDLYQRRSGSRYLRSQKRLFSWMLREGFITWPQYGSAVLGRAAAALMPGALRAVLYQRVLREGAE